MKLSQAINLSRNSSLALVGAGGKTTALFHLARELEPSVVTTTTHLGTWQVAQADRHLKIFSDDAFPDFESQFIAGVTLVTGPIEGERIKGVNNEVLSWLHARCKECSIPLLIEADGARQLPLKAPTKDEPVIPEFIENVMVIIGFSGIGKPLTGEFVRHPDEFSQITGLHKGETISTEAVYRVLIHPSGGLKNIPINARRIVLLNQADSKKQREQGKYLADKLLPTYHSVIVASLEQSQVYAVYEPVAGIILAAGESKRFGSPKQILEWHGKSFIRHVAEAGLSAGLSPLVVVTGSNADAIEAQIHDLPLIIRQNLNWIDGQSTSIKTGLSALPAETGAVLFLLADQPQITPTLLRALVEQHSLQKNPIIAPMVHGRRANPVLFDKFVFPDLMKLTGDVGGRAVFNKHPVTYLPWHDGNLLTDIDTPDDYQNLLNNM